MKKMDIISTRNMSRDFIEDVLEKTKKMEPIAKAKKQVDMLKGKTLATLFFEPSTRTKLSFMAAMNLLGGTVIGFDDPRTSSVKKGETLADTIRVVEGYANAIVIRHPNEGAAALAAKFSEVPIINGGDGSNQHPTQALLDMYTILKEKGKLDGLKVTLAGDLKYGRTVHSLAYALSKFDVSFVFASPPSLRMPRWIVSDLKSSGISIKEIDSIEVKSDVLYLTRIQKERFPDIEEYQRVSSAYILDEETLKELGEETMIMHPLPRVNEISHEVDNDRRAKYFVQSFYGVPTRMALLAMVMADI
ncbi:MAG: aspartate carbamoyltransferase [Candidatus Aenigmarchaeota archaeon ex4484_14]|nr:MAG: aspartate carbamoyltransferase [Candidatus Aenigmarchaeota archaeon ex4484_14]